MILAYALSNPAFAAASCCNGGDRTWDEFDCRLNKFEGAHAGPFAFVVERLIDWMSKSTRRGESRTNFTASPRIAAQAKKNRDRSRQGAMAERAGQSAVLFADCGAG